MACRCAPFTIIIIRESIINMVVTFVHDVFYRVTRRKEVAHFYYWFAGFIRETLRTTPHGPAPPKKDKGVLLVFILMSDFVFSPPALNRRRGRPSMASGAGWCQTAGVSQLWSNDHGVH